MSKITWHYGENPPLKLGDWGESIYLGRGDGAPSGCRSTWRNGNAERRPPEHGGVRAPEPVEDFAGTVQPRILAMLLANAEKQPRRDRKHPLRESGVRPIDSEVKLIAAAYRDTPEPSDADEDWTGDP